MAGLSDHRRVAEHGGGVRRNRLDGAGMDAGPMGNTVRAACGNSSGGLLLAVLVGIVVLCQSLLVGKARSLLLVISSAATVLLPVAVFILYYNWRVTGDPLTMPYTLHARQYMAAPLFFWQKPVTPMPQ